MTKEILVSILTSAVSALCRDVKAWMDYFRHGHAKPIVSLSIHFKDGQSAILKALDLYAEEPSEGMVELSVEALSECEILLENYIVNVKPEGRKANGKAGDARDVQQALLGIIAFFAQRGILSPHEKLKYYELRIGLVTKMNKLIEPIELRETRRVSFVDDGSEKIGRFLVSPDRSMIKDTMRNLTYSGMTNGVFRKYIGGLLDDYRIKGDGFRPGSSSNISKAFQRGDCKRFRKEQLVNEIVSISDDKHQSVWHILRDDEIS